MAHEIHVKTVDGGVVYDNALSYGREQGELWVQVGDDPDQADTIYFASGYWQQYVIDPHSEDPLDLDEIYEDDDEYEYYEDEDEDEDEDEPDDDAAVGSAL